MFAGYKSKIFYHFIPNYKTICPCTIGNYAAKLKYALCIISRVLRAALLLQQKHRIHHLEYSFDALHKMTST